MSECKNCGSERIMKITSKCSDRCILRYNDETGTKDYIGYVPYNLGIGGGDYVELKLCLNCGQVQGKFPITKKAVKEVRWEKRK